MEERLTTAQIRKLSIAERILLVQDIWDSIAEEHESLKVAAAQQDELDRRIEAYIKSPSEGSTWDEVKARLKGFR
jgi:putative addiction module component (TIGR02574 family)